VGELSEVGVLKDTPLIIGCVKKVKINFFNTSEYYTITLLQQFMSEIIFHTTKLLYHTFQKNDDFLGDTGIDNNYI
jgi:hypothetical protein